MDEFYHVISRITFVVFMNLANTVRDEDKRHEGIRKDEKDRTWKE